MRWLLSLVLAALAASPAPAAERRKVIIDQDALEGPGLQPTLMILQNPSVEVLGITIVSGGGWPRLTLVTNDASERAIADQALLTATSGVKAVSRPC